jgi:hypothetical protein
MLFKLNLCQPCAAKLRAILARSGEAAMAKAIGETLCRDCRAKLPGHEPGRKLTVTLKKDLLKPIGHG